MNHSRNQLVPIAASMVVAILSLVSCHPAGMMDDVFAPRPNGPFSCDCSPGPDDPEG